MQKKLALVAAVAGALAAPAAFAEVTLSGHLDIGLQRVDPGDHYDGSELFLNDQQGSGGSFLNFSAREDLGRGLTGLAVIEVGFLSDTGNFDNTVTANDTLKFAQRQVFAGLAGGFGTLTAGRQYREAFLVGNGSAYNYTAAGVGVFFLNQYTGVRQDNIVKYASPSLGGATVVASYGFGEGTAANTEDDGYTEIGVKWGAGPLRLGAVVATSTATDVDTDVVVAGGQFALSPATTIYALYTTGETEGNAMDASSISLGVKQTVGNGDAVLQVGQSKNDLVDDGDATLIGVGYYHRLSKTTTLYASYATVDNDANAAQVAPRQAAGTATVGGMAFNGAAGEDPSTLSLGMRLIF